MKTWISACVIVAALPAMAAVNLHLCDVRDFGAAGDGQRKDTAAIQAAIESCAKGGGGTVFLPPGHYLTGAVTLRSHITLDVGPGAVILGSENPADYPLHENVYGGERKSLSSLIYADGVEDITLTGRGTIDGQGQVWWKRQ
jgi:polygalacturonase